LPTAASDIVLGWVCNGAVESSGAEFAPLGRYLREDAVTEQRVQRRLAAILAADVVGYSALMQRAEEATYAEFERLKRELIQPQAARAPLRRHSNCRHQFL
jgi:class 3 adenylate cyclase